MLSRQPAFAGCPGSLHGWSSAPPWGVCTQMPSEVARRLQRQEDLGGQLQEQYQQVAAECQGVSTRTAAKWEELHQAVADVSGRQASAMQLLQAHAVQQEQQRQAHGQALAQQQQAQAAQDAAVSAALTEVSKRMEVLELLSERLAKHVLLAGRPTASRSSAASSAAR